jgi:hypothetical protein
LLGTTLTYWLQGGILPTISLRRPGRERWTWRREIEEEHRIRGCRRPALYPCTHGPQTLCGAKGDQHSVPSTAILLALAADSSPARRSQVASSPGGPAGQAERSQVRQDCHLKGRCISSSQAPQKGNDPNTKLENKLRNAKWKSKKRRIVEARHTCHPPAGGRGRPRAHTEDLGQRAPRALRGHAAKQGPSREGVAPQGVGQGPPKLCGRRLQPSRRARGEPKRATSSRRASQGRGACRAPTRRTRCAPPLGKTAKPRPPRLTSSEENQRALGVTRRTFLLRTSSAKPVGALARRASTPTRRVPKCVERRSRIGSAQNQTKPYRTVVGKKRADLLVPTVGQSVESCFRFGVPAGPVRAWVEGALSRGTLGGRAPR